jgi:hypothetical protein
VVSTTRQPLYPRERPGTHRTGGWVGPRAGLDVCEKFRPTRIRYLDRPARSQSLYSLSYPAHSQSLRYERNKHSHMFYNNYISSVNKPVGVIVQLHKCDYLSK